MALRTQFLGKAGEYMVASQLLLRGVPVALPAVDEGVDIYAGHLRIQVKAARKIKVKTAGSWGYHFNIGTHKWNAQTRTFYRKRDARAAVDFYVFWGIDENRFWIVPSNLLPQCNVRIVEDSKRYTINADEVAALLGTGLSQREVAKRLQISEMSVSRVVNGDLPKTKPGKCHEVIKRENAWHEIISALGLVNSIEDTQEILSNA